MKAKAWLVGALSAGLLASCTQTKTEVPLTPVTVRPAMQYAGDEGLRYSANVEPYTTVNLSFKVPGYVTEILQVQGADGRSRNVQDGDAVRKGMLLTQLRQTEFQDRVAEAKARLAQSSAELEKATLDYERAQTLFSAQSLTKPDYDSAKARYDAAQAIRQGILAALGQAETELRDSSLRTPNDGVLLKRAIEVGGLVTPGTVAFVLADTRAMKVVFGVPDVMLAQAKPGRPLKISTQSLGLEELVGRVTRVSPAADPQTRLFDVELTIPNPGNRLKAGMIASLQVPRARAPELVTVVPLSSVVTSKGGEGPGGYAVYVIEESGETVTARRRSVKLGEAYGNTIAVTEGIRPGERVVASGTMLLNDGDRVRIVPAAVPR